MRPPTWLGVGVRGRVRGSRVSGGRVRVVRVSRVRGRMRPPTTRESSSARGSGRR